MRPPLGSLSLALGLALPGFADGRLNIQFERIEVTPDFYAEGICAGDFNRDGVLDLAYGPFWYAGPDFKQRHEITAPPAKPFDPINYSVSFLQYAVDLNGDGWTDIVVVGYPGKETFWYENPQGKAGRWARHTFLANTDNESPLLADVNGDGFPDLVCMSAGQVGYATLDPKNPAKDGVFHAVSAKDAKKYQRFTHGIGAGDLNGDGKIDLLEKDGWWEQPKDGSTAKPWIFHAVPFSAGRNGGAQMIVADVNGDGLADVITSLDAHRYGLSWFEQQRTAQGEISFSEHRLMDAKPEDSAFGLNLSQMHALVWADIDGDGVNDLVTGKRYWAHGPKGDVDAASKPVVTWFSFANKDGKVTVTPHLADEHAGIGTQFAVVDLNKDGLPDIIVGNKRGVHILLQKK